MSTTLEQDLTTLLNSHSAEGASDTPDFILARYMLDCLGAYNAAQVRRADWFSQSRTPTPTLDDLHLSVRVSHVIENLGVKTLDDLCAITPRQLRRAKNCGTRSYQEVVLALSRVGRSLASEKKRGES